MNTINTILRVGYVLLGVFLNVMMVTLIWDYSENSYIATGGYALFYGIFFCLMLTPVGDQWLDLSIGTRKPSRKELDILEGIENSLREDAKRSHTKYPSNIRLRMISDPFPNAIAFGNRSIALTSGLLNSGSQDELEGVFSHEVGHLVNKDTFSNLVGYASYGPLLWIGHLLWGLTIILSSFGPVGFVVGLMVLAILFPAGLALLLGILFNFIQSFTNRSIEYRADAYAIKLTKSNGLIEFLKQIEHLDISPSGRFMAAYQMSHPPTALREDRAEKILLEVEGY